MGNTLCMNGEEIKYTASPITNFGKICLLILFLFSFCQPAKSQGKGYLVPVSVFYIDAGVAPYNQVKGGDTLYLQAGNRNYLQFRNFQGKAGLPIIIINRGGDVIIDTDNYYGISIQNCRYIKLTGTGFSGMMYGFKIKRVANGAGMGIGSLSSDFEIDHVSIENTLIGGLYAKTDPDCTGTTTRGVFTQYNTIIHDNYIANTGDEGMYIGSTKFSGQVVNCNGKDTLLMPSLLDGVRIYNNIVKYTGWDGIQVSSASKNCQIYNNTILFDSQAGLDTQMSGIIIGGGTKCDCFNNYISDGKGVGIECHGLGGSRIFNNIIVNPGLTYFPGDFSKPKHGIYISDNSVQKDSSFYVFNNDIIHPKSDGIRFASVLSKGNLISSNVIINPGNFDYYQNGNTSVKGVDSYIMIQNAASDVVQKTNYFARNGTSAGFLSQTMHDASDFTLVAGSVLIDAAEANPKTSTTFDFAGNPRPYGPKSDIGAFEFILCSNPVAGGAIGNTQTICSGSVPSPLTSITLPVGTTNALDFKWQMSTSSVNEDFIDVANSNSASYSPGALNVTTWFRRLAKAKCFGNWTGAAASNVVIIRINPAPTAIAGANRTICAGSGTQIGGTVLPGNTYSWTSSPIGFTSNLANPSVTPFITTTYTLIETNTASGCSHSQSVTVTVNPLPGSAGTVIGTNKVCAGAQSLAYSISPVANATGYVWSIPAGASIVSGSNTNSILIDLSPSAVSGSISVYGSNACGRGSASQTFNLTVNPVPSAPIASVVGNTVVSSALQGNQWYYSGAKDLFGTEIAGATGQIYTPTQNGWYQSIVTLNGCKSAPSSQVYSLISGENSQYNVYPVPNRGQFSVIISSTSQEEFVIQIFDQLGHKIYDRPGLRIDGDYIQEINLNSPESGIYTVIVRNTSGDVFTKKMIVFK